MKSITVTAVVNRKPDEVWERWTNPAHIKHWAFASDDWGVGPVENDVRAGGKFKTNMFARDGSASFDFEGTYTAVEQHRALAYTLAGADGRKVAVQFEDLGAATKVSETFEMESENPEELQRAGWQAILDNFKKHAENS